MADFSPRNLRAVVEATSAELGPDNLTAVLEKAGLSVLLADVEAVARFDASAAAQACAGLQQAVRAYYGRGARGILQRVGARLWPKMIAAAPFTVKAQIAIVEALPAAARVKPALELLAKLLSAKPGDITIHSIDPDFLLVDHASPAAHEQQEHDPVCWLTVGLTHECLRWATRREFDVTETSCCALGAAQCEFRITKGT